MSGADYTVEQRKQETLLVERAKERAASGTDASQKPPKGQNANDYVPWRFGLLAVYCGERIYTSP